MTSLWLDLSINSMRNSNTDSMWIEFLCLCGHMKSTVKIYKATSEPKSSNASLIWSWEMPLTALMRLTISMPAIRNWKANPKEKPWARRNKEMNRISFCRLNLTSLTVAQILNYWNSFQNGALTLSSHRLFWVILFVCWTMYCQLSSTPPVLWPTGSWYRSSNSKRMLFLAISSKFMWTWM